MRILRDTFDCGPSIFRVENTKYSIRAGLVPRKAADASVLY